MTQIQMKDYYRSHGKHPQSSPVICTSFFNKNNNKHNNNLQVDKIVGLLTALAFILFLCVTTILHSSLPAAVVDVVPESHPVLGTAAHGKDNQRHVLDQDTHTDDDRRRRRRRRSQYNQRYDPHRHQAKDSKQDAFLQSANVLRDNDAKAPKLSPFSKYNTRAQNLHDFVQKIRKPKHKVHKRALEDLTYDVDNCPEFPPPHYPLEWPILDLIDHWSPSNISASFRPDIYQAICRFDFKTEFHKALNYINAEVPFVMRDDPEILKVVERWNREDYLSRILGKDIMYRTEYSETNSLMFYRDLKSVTKPLGWKPPMRDVKMTYDEWVEKASQSEDAMGVDKPHWYFRVNAKGGTDHFMFRELPFFLPKKNFYIVDELDTRGINCRFGMMGNMAVAHFDGSRNFVMLFGGERRYILSHPRNCRNLALYPRNHPSGRHSAVDWSNPDLEQYPDFQNAHGNEVVLQAGDALYLPTQWFHFIVSLDLNWQCNARSGITKHYEDHILQCGF